MSSTTYRLFDGMTLVSTAVKLTDGSILVNRPWLRAFNNVNDWKSEIEFENASVLSLSTHVTFPIDDTPYAAGLEPLSPCTPSVKTAVHDDVTTIHKELASLSRIMNRRMELLDTRVKALLQKLD